MVLITRPAIRLPALLTGLLLCAISLTSTPLWAQRVYELKFATLAPAGTTWVNLLEEWAETVKQESEGRLIFKIYPRGLHRLRHRPHLFTDPCPGTAVSV
jgi:TRAP-type C4-dicarboxylate transport system substrate-binding protein